MITNTVEGTTSVEGGIGVITVRSVYATSIDDLWGAVTSTDRLRRWWGDIRPRDDGTYTADLSTGWSGTAVVQRCDPPHRVDLILRDEAESTTVSAVLEPTADGIRLTIQERGLPVDDLPTYVAGWHAQLDQLEATLSDAADVPWRPRWSQLREQYRAAEEG